MNPEMRVLLFLATTLIVAALGCQPTEVDSTTQQRENIPQFEVDPLWPNQLPNQWIIGAVAGVAVDSRDHVWIVHRPSTLQPNELRSEWVAAPPVLEFDPTGNVVAAWGGPGSGYEWPELEHGVYVDARDNVWLGGGGESDAQVLKFSRQGEFLMQIGRQGRNGGSNETTNLGGAANMVVDEEASADVRASAQSLFNLVIIGIGVIVAAVGVAFISPRRRPMTS